MPILVLLREGPFSARLIDLRAGLRMPTERSGVLLSRWWSARRELQAQPLACFVIQPYPDISSLLQHVLIVKAAVARLDAASLQEKGVRKRWSW